MTNQQTVEALLEPIVPTFAEMIFAHLEEQTDKQKRAAKQGAVTRSATDANRVTA